MINHSNMPENFTSKNRVVEYNGKKMTFEEWAKHLEMPMSTIIQRVYRGWSVEEAFSIPVKKENYGKKREQLADHLKINI